MNTLWRCRLAKRGRMRYLSHLDLLRAVGRAFRRAGVVLSQSGGFHPHSLISFGPALAVGVESCAEYFDATTREPLDAAALQGGINHVLPDGLCLLAVQRLAAPGVSLASSIKAASYRVWMEGAPEAIAAVAVLLAKGDLIGERVGSDGTRRLLELRPLLLEFDVTRLAGAQLALLAVVGSAGNLRPHDLLRLAQGVQVVRIVRTGLYQRSDGFLLEPMHADVVDWRELTWARE